MIRAHRWLGLVALAAVLGCGGSGPSIEHQMPMDKLWSAPPEERDAVAAAHTQLLQLRSELAHAQFLLEDTKRQEAIARAERDRARQDARIAKLQKQRHAASYKTSLVQTATDAITSSHDREDTLGRKRRWLDVRHDYLKREVARLDAEVYAAEAKLELEKARLAAKRGAATPQEMQAFEAQAQRAEQRAAGRRQAAENARAKAEAAQKAWGGSTE